MDQVDVRSACEHHCLEQEQADLALTSVRIAQYGYSFVQVNDG